MGENKDITQEPILQKFKAINDRIDDLEEERLNYIADELRTIYGDDLTHETYAIQIYNSQGFVELEYIFPRYGNDSVRITGNTLIDGVNFMIWTEEVEVFMPNFMDRIKEGVVITFEKIRERREKEYNKEKE